MVLLLFLDLESDGASILELEWELLGLLELEFCCVEEAIVLMLSSSQFSSKGTGLEGS